MPFLRDEDSPPPDGEHSSPLLPSPGRDSSRLMQDLSEHTFADPRIHTPPPHFDATKPHTYPEAAHTHSWIMKTRASIGSRPWNAHAGNSSVYVVCETCRIHMWLMATLTGEDIPKCGTPGSAKRYHHFHLESWSSNSRYSSSTAATESKPEHGLYQCCQCPLTLRIEFWPLVVPEYLLSTVKRRKTGNNSALNIINRSKEGPSAYVTLTTLATYCTHLLNNSGGSGGRAIMTNEGSPFARRVGMDPDLLRFVEYLGWTHDREGSMLIPPSWDESLHKGRLRRKLVEAAEIELAQLAMENFTETDKPDKSGKNAFEPNLIRGEPDIAALLSAPWPRQGFESSRSENYFRKTIHLDNPVNPSFVVLGTTTDADENAIIEGYLKQVDDDPVNMTFYLECLQDVGSAKTSRKINQFADEEVNDKKVYTRFDLQRAYRKLEIDHPDEIGDDGVVAVFQSRCHDAPERTVEFENALMIIQRFRGVIIGVETPQEKREMTIEEAYRRLRISDQSVGDDIVIAHFVSYSVEEPSERDLLTEALQLIGKERNSVGIRTYLSENNESSAAIGPVNRQMSLDEAYIVLGVEGGARHDDAAIIVAYDELVNVQPARTEEFKKAVEVIADHRDSIPLKTFLIDKNTTPDKQAAGQRQGTNPVGLENIAQTCYMNSLFQYYFTVKPLRDAILNYEQHEEGELSEDELKRKQISKWELERSKRFIEQLRLLFQELITSDLAYIRPKEELVRLTLIDVKQEVEEEEVKRRQSLLTNVSHSMDSDLPDLIELEDASVPPVPVSSPDMIPTAGEKLPEFESPIRQTSSQIANIQLSAEDTDYEFVEDPAAELSVSTSDKMSVDKENDQQPRQGSRSSTDKSLQDKAPLQKSQKINVMEEDSKDPDDVEMTDFGVMTPPKTPPPVPARPRRKSTWGVLKYGSQQDVTECITNCLSQLHAAFKPEEIDSKGDQIDMFKRLFYIRVRQLFRDVRAGPDAKPIDEKEELYGSMVPIYVDAQVGGTLYDAIDLALGREKIDYQGVGEVEKSTTVTYLPPILQFQIVRAQFNRSVGAGYKENAHIELESKIYMDRYVDNDENDFNARRDDYWKWKAELEQAQKKKAELLKKGELPFNPLETLSMARNFLERFSASGVNAIPPQLLDGLALYENDLRIQVEKLDKQVDNLKSRIKQQFTDRRKYGYRLHSVFIHRGDVAHGHYWIYIYDFALNKWFKYNDEQVTEVDEKVVFADNSAEGAGPYFVTYVKEEEVEAWLNGRPSVYGSYYTIPDISTLAASNVTHVENLIVGRFGYGEVKFDQPVDLSRISLHDLHGIVVRFERGLCEVYPENGPPVGEGLNVPALVKLYGCFPEPVDGHTDLSAYVLGLESKHEAKFIAYDILTGTWTFRVNHFSAFSVGSDITYSSSRRSASSYSTSLSSSQASLPAPATNSTTETEQHQLRSQAVSSNPMIYAASRQKPRLVTLVREAYEFWKQQKQIPAEILGKIEEYELTPSEFFEIFPNLEDPAVTAIELIDGKVVFRSYTTTAHGCVIALMIRQIGRQDNPTILADSTNFSIPLGPSVKQPDCAWSARTNRLPNQGQGHTFVAVPNEHVLFPVIVAEIAISNETPVQLATRDIQRYFLPGTGTRWWVGIKVFKSDPPGVTRWWAGHAFRDYDVQNNVWLDSFTFDPNSMQTNLNADAPLSDGVAGLRFSAQVNFLLQPVGPPAGYPNSLYFDLEEIRQDLLEYLS